MPVKPLDAPKGTLIQVLCGNMSRQYMDMTSTQLKGTRAVTMTVHQATTKITNLKIREDLVVWTKIIQTIPEHHTAYQLSNLR